MLVFGTPSNPRLPLVDLTAGATFDRRILHHPGGFAWWYVDVLGPDGTGVVVIWSYGLPFLPGYLAKARAGAPERPIDRPSLNVVVYRRGRPAFYLLQEYAADEAIEIAPDLHRFAASDLSSARVRDRRQVALSLDCTVPGTEGRLRGVVELEGPARIAEEGPATSMHDHDWSPLVGPSRARVDLSLGDDPLCRFEGRGYHDRNASATSFHALGISHWIWGRAPLRDREAIFYLVFPDRRGVAPSLHLLEIDETGRTHVVSGAQARLERPRRGSFGMPYWRRLSLTGNGEPWLEVELGAPIDDGPFYLRHLTRVRHREGDVTEGTAESVRPGRVDRAPLRPLVRMRVHRTAGDNSMWLPLFAGRTRGRIGRSLSSIHSMAFGGRR